MTEVWYHDSMGIAYCATEDDHGYCVMVWDSACREDGATRIPYASEAQALAALDEARKLDREEVGK